MIKSLEEFIAEQEQSLEIHKLKLRIAAALPEGCIAANIHGYGSQTQRTSVHYLARSLIEALAIYEKMTSITVPYAEYRGGYIVSVLPYPGLDSRGKEMPEDHVQCMFYDSNPYLEVEVCAGVTINTLTFFVSVHTTQSSYSAKATSINTKVCIKLAQAAVKARKVPVIDGDTRSKHAPKRIEYYPDPHQDRAINWYAGDPEPGSIKASLFWATDRSFTAAMDSLLSTTV